MKGAAFIFKKKKQQLRKATIFWEKNKLLESLGLYWATSKEIWVFHAAMHHSYAQLITTTQNLTVQNQTKKTFTGAAKQCRRSRDQMLGLNYATVKICNGSSCWLFSLT